MAKLSHYMIHCLATPKGRAYTSDQVRIMHIGPHRLTVTEVQDAIKRYGSLEVLKPGAIKYKGKFYNDTTLPQEKVGGMALNKILELGGGRGWNQVGYADMIHLDGRIENMVPYNEDDNVDAWELSNGIMANNPIYMNTRHLVYVGGMDKSNKNPEDTRTQEQLTSMLNKVHETIGRHPGILICGHNQFDNRACPSFSVPQWCLAKSIDAKNICKESMKYNGAL